MILEIGSETFVGGEKLLLLENGQLIWENFKWCEPEVWHEK